MQIADLCDVLAQKGFRPFTGAVHQRRIGLGAFLHLFLRFFQRDGLVDRRDGGQQPGVAVDIGEGALVGLGLAADLRVGNRDGDDVVRIRPLDSNI